MSETVKSITSLIPKMGIRMSIIVGFVLIGVLYFNSNNIIHIYKDKLAKCVLVFGAAGLAFYAVICIATVSMKYGMKVLGVQKGMSF